MNLRKDIMKHNLKLGAIAVASLFVLGGCSSINRVNNAQQELKQEMLRSTEPAEINSPIPYPSMKLETELSKTPVTFKQELNESYPKPLNKKEVRFNFVMNNAPVTTVLSALVDGSSYSMVLPQELAGNVTLNLKNVTAFDVLETLRRVYNYEYEVDDKKIIVYPNGLRTKVFIVNHLVGVRQGRTELKISSGSLTDSSSSNVQTSSSGVVTNNNNNNTARSSESAKVVTTVDSDFWKEMSSVLGNLIGNEKGRSIVVSPQTNTIVVKAMPSELMEVENYLRKIQAIIDKQVIIEAKLIEVQLRNGMQTGINWAAFRQGNSKASIGFGAAGSTLGNSGDLSLSGNNQVTSTPGANLVTGTLANANAMFSLAFQTSNFASILNFLETQGQLQVLSSPRIATLNNQKAILKVGTDEFFITNVTTTSTSTSAGTTNTPSVTTQPFFSGIALDITPQIDDKGMVTMHVRPSVSQVSTVTKNVNLGSLGSIVLPLASSTISETDSIVRAENNQIVAIGGLMKQYSKKDKSQVPGAADVPVVGNAFKNTDDDYLKYELVILLKPQIVANSSDWSRNLDEIRQRLADFDQPLKNIVINETKSSRKEEVHAVEILSVKKEDTKSAKEEKKAAKNSKDKKQ